MLNIRRVDKKRNEDIYKMVAKEPLAVIVQQRQLQFHGHCLRKDEEELINKYVVYEPRESHGKRSRGKSRMLYSEFLDNGKVWQKRMILCVWAFMVRRRVIQDYEQVWNAIITEVTKHNFVLSPKTCMFDIELASMIHISH